MKNIKKGAKIKIKVTNVFKVIIIALLVIAFTVSMISCKGEITETTSSILDNALFYTGLRPIPSDVTFTNSHGDLVTMLAYPGQVNIFVAPQTDVTTVQTLVQQHGEKILSQIPVLGVYLIQVDIGNEANFIAEVRLSSIVLDASPNPVLRLQQYPLVDLSDTGKEPSELVPALLYSPDPNSTVIVALIEDFRKGSEHAKNVARELEEITGERELLKVHVGETPCRMPAELCSSGDRVLLGLTAAIAGAELNGQDLIINLSYGIPTHTTDKRKFDGDPAWAVKELEEEQRQILNTLYASEWVRQGHVTLNHASGNGMDLLEGDENGNPVVKNGVHVVLDNKGVDLSPALARLRTDPRYDWLYDNVISLCGALNSDGTLASYSNYGKGVIYGIPHFDKEGTSYVAPQVSGAQYNARRFFPNLTSSQIVQDIKTGFYTNKDGILTPSDFITDEKVLYEKAEESEAKPPIGDLTPARDLKGTWKSSLSGKGLQLYGKFVMGDVTTTVYEDGDIELIIDSIENNTASGKIRYTNLCIHIEATGPDGFYTVVEDVLPDSGYGPITIRVSGSALDFGTLATNGFTFTMQGGYTTDLMSGTMTATTPYGVLKGEFHLTRQR